MSELQALLDESPAMVFVSDADGTLRHHGRALAELLGHRLSVGQPLAALSDEGGRAALESFLAGLTSETGSLEVASRGRDDQPLRVLCKARRGADGKIHGVLELVEAAHPMAEVMLRGILDTLDIVVWAIDPSGVFVFHDGKALAQAGLTPGQFLGLSIYDLYPPELLEPVHAVLAGSPSHQTSEAHGLHWETWYLPLTDSSGQLDYCLAVTLDVTKQAGTAADLVRQLETIRRQQRAIHELSAPVLSVWDGVLAVPLIGLMDAERTNELTDRLLAVAHQHETRYAILDLTGVEAVDTSIASHVIGLLGVLRLLGVEGLITGVSPQVAQTMIGVGIDFGGVQTHRTLREGLRSCMRKIYEIQG